jgi:carboxypeptidase Taq
MTNSYDDPRYNQLREMVRESALLSSMQSVLGWDEVTKMPAKAAPWRADQVSLLAGLAHKKMTDPRLGELLEQLAEDPAIIEDPDSNAAVTVRRLRRTYDKKTKLPDALVKELSRTASLGQSVWEKARADDDFKMFAPTLEKTFALKREEADALGWDDCRYDALLDDYEPEAKTAELQTVLCGLRDELVPLLESVRDSRSGPDDKIFRQNFPKNIQDPLVRQAAELIGFDFSRGRLDTTAHPMCTELGPFDCRITTRFDEQFLPSAFFGVMHEAGHGIYEQGMCTEQFGLPLGMAVSLAIHESQSRLWENLVGRSHAFWEYFLPKAQAAFPEQLGPISLDQFYHSINVVEPSLVRVEADEATYNLHILIRFELEQALLDEQLSVADLPGAWNDLYEKYLGIRPKNFAEGVLQDVHWSAGLVGYFPTYAIGNLCASQFFAAAENEVGPLSEQFAAGDFGPLRGWLREKIHSQGQRYFAPELVERVTGKPLSHDALLDHLKTKLKPLYDLN